MGSMCLLLLLSLAQVPCLTGKTFRSNLRSQEGGAFQHNQSAAESTLDTTQVHSNKTDTASSAQPAQPLEQTHSVSLDHPYRPLHTVSSEVDMKGLVMLEHQLVTTVKTHKLLLLAGDEFCVTLLPYGVW